MTREITLSGGQIALVDDADYESLMQHRWSIDGSGYARGWHKGKKVAMHRLIVGFPEGKQVDHINRIRLDNRRSNLRICTHQDNTHNVTHQVRGTCEFRGVSWVHRRQQWTVFICVDGRNKYLGGFNDSVAAAKAYDAAARKYHGDFATLNFEYTES